MRHKSLRISFCCLTAIGSGPTVADGDTLTLLYSDLAPYVVAAADEPEGFLADHLEAAAAQADITLAWRYIPWAQQLALLKRSPPNVCGVGLFNTAERRKFLTFTEAVGKDYGMAVAARRGDARVARHSSLKTLLDDPELRGVVQKDTSYGPYIDPLLEGRKMMEASGSTLRLLRDLAAGNGDYLLATKPTFEAVVQNHQMGEQLVIRSDLEDMQDDVLFFLGCTKTSDADLLDRLNAVLRVIGPVCPEGPCPAD